MNKRIKLLLGEIFVMMGAAALVCGHFLVENTPKYKWTDAFETYTDFLPVIGWMLLVAGAVDIVIALCSSEQEESKEATPLVQSGKLTKECPGCGLMVAKHIKNCPNCKMDIE